MEVEDSGEGDLNRKKAGWRYSIGPCMDGGTVLVNVTRASLHTNFYKKDT
jgi:hypothetical protein